MKAQVVKYFTDKQTRVKHLPGDDVDLSNDRFQQLLSLGLVKPIDEKPKEKKIQTPKEKK